MTIKHLFPAVWPDLNLDFANSKELDPRITFTRSSAGTYVDENGIIQTAVDDQPRFDHDPATGESLGLLIEESRTNLLTYSEQFDQWDKGNNTTITPNAATAPDGSMTADRAEFPAATLSYIKQNSLIVAGTTYTGSVWAKAVTPGTNAQFALHYGNGAGEVVSFFTATGEWQRFTSTASPTTPGNFGINNFGDTFASDIYIWGAQLEAGGFPSSYVKTTGTVENRAADVCSIEGTNFSSWYNQDEGAYLIEAIGPAANTYYLSSFRGSSGNVGVGFRVKGSFVELKALNSNAIVISNSTMTGCDITDGVKVAFTYDNGVLFGRGSGSTVKPNLRPDQAGRVPLPGITNLNFSYTDYTYHVKRAVYYSRRLSDEQLQALTS